MRETHRAKRNLLINKLNFTLRGEIIANKYSVKVLRRGKTFLLWLSFFCFCHLHQFVSNAWWENAPSSDLRLLLLILRRKLSSSENEVIIIWKRVSNVNMEIMEIRNGSGRKNLVTKCLKLIRTRECRPEMEWSDRATSIWSCQLQAAFAFEGHFSN